MPNASTRIDGRLARDPRMGAFPDGTPVMNVTVIASTSRKIADTGDPARDWETLTRTSYDCAFPGHLSTLVAELAPAKGDRVIVSGEITGLHSWQGQQGGDPLLSARVTADGIRVIRPRQDRRQDDAKGPGGWGQQGDPWAGQGGWEDAPF